MLAHFYPGLRVADLTLREAIGYLNRLPDIVGVAGAKGPTDGDILEMDYLRARDGI
jgi:hypothetical protein